VCGQRESTAYPGVNVSVMKKVARTKET
jgi:hypothetical protein